MKKNDDEAIERLVAKMMQHTSLEKPSDNFTKNIMASIISNETSVTFAYKPLISKRTWMIIAAAIFGIVIYCLTAPSAAVPGFTFIPNYLQKIGKSVPVFQVSSTTASVLVVATLMICVQIFLLKNYLNKKISH